MENFIILFPYDIHRFLQCIWLRWKVMDMIIWDVNTKHFEMVYSQKLQSG